MAEGKQSVSELVKTVEKGKEFIEWRKTDKGAYLSSIFIMTESVEKLSGGESVRKNENEWLLSYYSKGGDAFTTFSSTGSQKAAGEEAFKKGKTLPKLDIGKVKVQVWGSVKKAEKLRQEGYKGEEPTKVIAILQPLTADEIFGSKRGSAAKTKAKNVTSARPVWNITYITSSFNVLNVKIDAETGNVLNHRLSSVMDFAQKAK